MKIVQKKMEEMLQDIEANLDRLTNKKEKILLFRDIYDYLTKIKDQPLSNSNSDLHRLTDDPCSQKIYDLITYDPFFEKTNDKKEKSVREIIRRYGNRSMTEQEYNYLVNTPIRKIVKNMKKGYKFG